MSELHSAIAFSLVIIIVDGDPDAVMELTMIGECLNIHRAFQETCEDSAESTIPLLK